MLCAELPRQGVDDHLLMILRQRGELDSDVRTELSSHDLHRAMMDATAALRTRVVEEQITMLRILLRDGAAEIDADQPERGAEGLLEGIRRRIGDAGLRGHRGQRALRSKGERGGETEYLRVSLHLPHCIYAVREMQRY